MGKSRDAFRTISEVAEWLDTPAHVLRFWESKFTQIKPVKRAGGRRYYRPEDMALLAGIKVLLHEQGLTIKGAQKLIREKGVTAVAGIGDGYFDDSDDEIDLQPDTAAQPEPDADTALGSGWAAVSMAQQKRRPRAKNPTPTVARIRASL